MVYELHIQSMFPSLLATLSLFIHVLHFSSQPHPLTHTQPTILYFTLMREQAGTQMAELLLYQ